jgi:hypothetical protein
MAKQALLALVKVKLRRHSTAIVVPDLIPGARLHRWNRRRINSGMTKMDQE